MPDMEPITREEALMNGDYIEPITREEMILAGEDIEPITRREWFLKKYRGGGDVEVVTLHANENTTYVAPEGQAYSPVVVEVPVPTLTTLEVDENGTYTAPTGTAYNEVEVDVPLPENAYLLKDIPNTPTAIATFSDGSNLPMPKLEVGIEPVQEGSGDPSPENVRPISGWDEVNVTRCGKNLIPSITEGVELASQTGTTRPNVDWYVTDYSRVEYGKTYYVSGTSSATVCYYDRYKNFTRNTLSQRTITPQEGECYVRVNSLISGYEEPQIEEGNEATSFSPFGHTYTIDLDGTRYGGKVDLVSGVMTVDRVELDLGSRTYNKSSDGYFYCFTTDLNFVSFDKDNPNAECEIYKLCTYAEYTSKTVDSAIFGNNNSHVIYIADSRFTDVNDLKTALNGVKLAYELATPLTIQLPTTVVKSLEGVNNVFADSGDVLNAEYFSKEE